MLILTKELFEYWRCNAQSLLGARDDAMIKVEEHLLIRRIEEISQYLSPFKRFHRTFDRELKLR